MLKIAVVMDPIASINIHKDTSFALMLEAQTRGWSIDYIEQPDLYMCDSISYANARPLTLKRDPQQWFQLGEQRAIALQDYQAIFLRLDPPVNNEYIYTTYLLEQAERAGSLIVNRPQGLREANEKLFTAWFPELTPPTLVACDIAEFKNFLKEQKDIVVKPLDGMGGLNVYRLTDQDHNVSVILESMTNRGTRFIMAQRFLPEIKNGDKRILMIDGKPIEYALARLPAPGETRSNLAAGGHGEGRELTDRDRFIASTVGPPLKEKGILFAGLDIIGDHLTEVNVTSPTCVQELERLYDINICGRLMDCVEYIISS